MPRQEPTLVGARVAVRLAEPADAKEIVRYYADNADHLGRYESPKPRVFLTRSFWEQEALRRKHAFERDRALRVFVFEHDGSLGGSPRRVIGHIGISAIIRGAFHAAYLGYSLDGTVQGRGLMNESLALVIEYAFGEMNLHRLMANHDPENVRSGRVLARLGFVREGYARDYLFINGAWRDHVLTGLVNPDWKTPPGHLVRLDDGEVIYVSSTETADG